MSNERPNLVPVRPKMSGRAMPLPPRILIVSVIVALVAFAVGLQVSPTRTATLPAPSGFGPSSIPSAVALTPAVTPATPAVAPTLVVPSPPPSSPSSVTFTVTGTQADKVALVVRFVTAFNAALLDTASALFAVDANLQDCDYATHGIVAYQGLPAIRSWLVHRFADHDRLVIARIFNMNPDSDRTVGVDFALRSSDTIARLGVPNGLVPGSTATIVIDEAGQRILQVVLC